MVKLNGRYTEFPRGPYPHTSTQAPPLMITASARVDTGYSQWAWIAVSSSRIIAIVYTSVHSLCCIFMRFHKCVYVSIMVVSQNSFTLIFLCVVSENSLFTRIYQYFRLLRWLNGKESACQYRRCGFAPWVRKISWRRKRQPTPVFLPGKSLGQRSLVSYSLWGRKESDTTERLSM